MFWGECDINGYGRQQLYLDTGSGHGIEHGCKSNSNDIIYSKWKFVRM
jgi:hypothetical protein